MNRKSFFDFITSVPFIASALCLLLIVLFFIFFKPSYNYVYNSEVITHNSYLKFNKEKLVFYLSPNLYPEINKKSAWQKEIPDLELKKAALRKEIKILKSLKTSPNNPQTLFDTAMWYLVSSGIKTDLKQVKPTRAARLLASYYYLKIFNAKIPEYKETKALESQIIAYIKKKSQKEPEFNDYLNHVLLKDRTLPSSEEELRQKKLLTNTKQDVSLCDYYFENIDNNKISNPIRQLGFIISAKSCYLNKYKDNTDNQLVKIKLIKLNKLLKEFKFE